MFKFNFDTLSNQLLSMKTYHIIFAFALLFLFNCSNDDDGQGSEGGNEPMEEFIPLESVINLNIEGVEETIDFECQTQPSVYGLGIRNDISGKTFYDQNYTSIKIAEGKSFVYQLVVFDEVEMPAFDNDEFKTYLQENPDKVYFIIRYFENDIEYTNLIYDLVGLGTDFENHQLIAENNQFTYSLGEWNAFECLDENPTLELEVQYSGLLKSLDDSEDRLFELDMNVHIFKWKE